MDKGLMYLALLSDILPICALLYFNMEKISWNAAFCKFPETNNQLL